MRKHDVRHAVTGLALMLAAATLACDRSPASTAGDATTVGEVRIGAPAPLAGRAERSELAAKMAAQGRVMTANAADAVALSAPASRPPLSGADHSLSLASAIGADAGGAMLIRHGQASLEVHRVDDAVSKVRAAAAQYGGFVANTMLRSGRDEQRSATLELRVPTDRFDALVASLGALGKVESVSATAQDVGDEFVDLSARVANARRVEARLAEMVATRTGKLSDVLTVEQELARVREEIERYQARLNQLERRTAMSSLDISLHEPLPLLERQPGPGPLAEALAEAWRRAVGVVAWCIASLGLLIPLGALGAGLVLVTRRIWRGSSAAAA